jgi:DNA-binding NarL/FixJ family response regulator
MRTLIAESLPIFRKGLINTLSLNDSNKTFQEAGTFLETIQLLESQAYQLLFLDLDFEDLDGLQMVNKTVKRFQETKIIGLTLQLQKFEPGLLMNVGMKGYLCKNADLAQVELVTDTVQRGILCFPENSKPVHNWNANGIDGAVKSGRLAFDDLHYREKTILRLLVDEFSSAEIAVKMHLSENTVNTYRKSLMKKTKARNVAGLVKFAIYNGWA